MSRSVRVLLGNLEPLVRLGMSRVLSEQGAEVIGEEGRPAALVRLAARLRPDLVVLDLGRSDSRDLSAQLRAAAPQITIVLWARDEDAMEALAPGDRVPRRYFAQLPERLRSELVACQVAEPVADGQLPGA
jgi:DNA-binding NarL/FixJ family response regulator